MTESGYKIFKKEILGRGSYGTIVFKGESKDGRKVAVKKVLKYNNKIIDNEINLLIKSDRHGNILTYFGSEEDEDFVYLFLELCDFTLKDLIKSKKNYDKLDLVKQLIDGTIYLDKLGIVHRDLKPENVLISDGILKIGDMGVSKMLEKEEFSTITGTLGWKAPEMYDETMKGTKAVDIFSMGCLIYYIYTNGGHPFGDEDERVVNIKKMKKDISIEGIEDFWLKHLIESMIKKNPTERLKIENIKNHPFFWSKEKKNNFVPFISDFLCTYKDSPLSENLLKKQDKIFDKSWDLIIDDIIIKGCCPKYKSENFQSVIWLIRLWRNIYHHYFEFDDEVKEILSPSFHEYFIKKFPNLLLVLYREINRYQKVLKDKKEKMEDVQNEFKLILDNTIDKEELMNKKKNFLTSKLKITSLKFLKAFSDTNIQYLKDVFTNKDLIEETDQDSMIKLKKFILTSEEMNFDKMFEDYFLPEINNITDKEIESYICLIL
eukprot:gene12370-6038_t